MKNVLIFLAIAVEKDENDILLEEDTVIAILEEVSSHINVRQLTALIKWEMNPDNVSGIVSSRRKVAKQISETLLLTDLRREIVPMSKFFLYVALSVESSQEELIGAMFLSLMECSLSSIL